MLRSVRHWCAHVLFVICTKLLMILDVLCILYRVDGDLILGENIEEDLDFFC